MTEQRAPGVYVREVEPPPPAELRMSITGFVGQAERGPLHVPQVLISWGQFSDVFGGCVGHSYLAYAVYGFFLNGGSRCWVVRVAHESAEKAALEVVDGSGRPALRVEAASEGGWGNAVEVTVEERSAGDLVLARLAQDAQPGKTVTLSSVAGLGPGDRLTLVHGRDPFRREQKTVGAVDPSARTVTFAEALGQPFPAGSGALGRGFRLIIRYRPGGRLVREEVFDDLALDPAHPRYAGRIVNGDPPAEQVVRQLQLGGSILVRVAPPEGAQAAPGRPAAVLGRLLAGGGDGPHDLGQGAHRYYTGYDDGAPFRTGAGPARPAGDVEIAASAEAARGLAALEAVAEVGLVAIPDLIVQDLYAAVPADRVPPEGILFAEAPRGLLAADSAANLRAGQREMLRHCALLGERFALLDAPRGAEVGRGALRVEDWAAGFHLLPEARFGALYYPWVEPRPGDFGGRALFVPPCGHVAGVYARAEDERGIGKAPANEPLAGIVDLEVCVDDAAQALLNPQGVNCLRALPGRGLRVWGARTLSRDPQWRYVNVRRVALAIVKSISTGLRWTVFEPNDRNLREAIVASLRLLLTDLFQRGALAGARPEEAFFLQCDAETTPPELADAGAVVARVGFAPARPAEFLEVTIKRTAGALSVRERTA